MSKPVPRRPMTPDEVLMASKLGGCSFSPGTSVKRFARELGAVAHGDEPTITLKQAAFLRKMVHSYRRQIPKAVVAIAAQPYDEPLAAGPPPVAVDAPLFEREATSS